MKPTDQKIISLALLINRLSLGALFALAGIRKLLPSGDAGVMDKWSGFANFTASKAPLPEALGKTYGYLLPPVEFLAGLLLVLGLFTRGASFIIALMLVSFLVAMGLEWWPDSGPAFTKNIILLTLALLITATGSGKLAVRADGPLK